MNNFILDAVSFATAAHSGQKRKYVDEDYIQHPIRVAKEVALYFNDDSMIVAALLHDVLEDCPQISEEMINQRFGPYVLKIVKQLTHPPLSAGNRDIRKAIEIGQLKKADWETQTIKCVDIIDNIPSIVENDKDFGPRFVREKYDLIKVLDRAFPILYDKAFELIENYAKSLNLQLEKETV